MQDVTLEEVHELLGQALTAVEIKLGEAQEKRSPDQDDLKELLDAILGTTILSARLTGNG